MRKDAATIVDAAQRPVLTFPSMDGITGSAAQLHRVNQAPRRFPTREAFDAFADPEHEKLS